MTQIIAIRPVVVPAPDRGDDLPVRVTAPVTGTDLPVVLFSPGFGFSMDAYGPLTDYWAENGLVVISLTHLDAVAAGLAPTDPRTPRIWRHRIEDLRLVLDRLDTIIEAVPGLQPRMDTTRVGVAGHSYGATTASALLGARVFAPAGDPDEDFTDPRVSAGVLLALAGLAGDDLTPIATQFFPFMNPDFDSLRPATLFVAGDADQSVLTTRGPDWWTDAYRTSPGENSLSPSSTPSTPSAVSTPTAPCRSRTPTTPQASPSSNASRRPTYILHSAPTRPNGTHSGRTPEQTPTPSVASKSDDRTIPLPRTGPGPHHPSTAHAAINAPNWVPEVS